MNRPPLKGLHFFHHHTICNGVERTIFTLINQLRECGVDAQAVLPREGDAAEMLKAGGWDYDVFPLRCCESFVERGTLRFLSDSSRRIALLTDYIKKHEFDYVHINTGHMLDAAIAAAQCDVPLVWHIHAPFDHDYPRYKQFLTERAYAHLLDQLSARVVVVSNDCRESFSDYLNLEKVSVLYNGIDVEGVNNAALDGMNVRDEFSIPIDSPVLVGVGRISYAKNFTNFARVAAEILKHKKDVYFLVVGPLEEAESVQELEAVIAEHNLESRLFVLGGRLDVPAIVSQSDCFLSTARFEGQGIAALEAMALEKPVVAMDCEGLRECIRHDVDGLLVEQGNVEGAAKAVLKILNDKKLAQQYGVSGKGYVKQRFSSEIYGDGFLSIVNEAISVGPSTLSKAELDVIQGLISMVGTADEIIQKHESKKSFMGKIKNRVRGVVSGRAEGHTN